MEKGELPEISPLHCKWKCLNKIPNIRFESEGDPVPVRDNLFFLLDYITI